MYIIPCVSFTNAAVCCDRYGSLCPEERERIGMMCKQLLDTGENSLSVCRRTASSAKLISYTERSNTLENTAIVALQLTEN